jgi:mannose-binding lectin 2
MLRSIVTRLAWVAAALALVCAPQEAQAKLLDRVSFEKPFDAIDADGARRVGDNFESGGTAAVNRHFVRLTPDRQSKRGFIWGKQQLGAKEFEAVLTFRISGQAKSWFGDGLALWITDSQRYVQGDNHGFIGNFKGFGVVFDTFVNQEHAGGHKDVTFFENDGSKTLDQLNEMDKLGCMAPGIRYHEKNANFNPSTSLSRAKIQYKAQQLTISIDAAGTGQWEPCYTQRITISDDWMDKAVFGITASTGGLADNHDVIGLSVYEYVVVLMAFILMLMLAN